MVVRCLICQLTITTLHEQEKKLPYERVGLCSKCEEICREIVATSNNLKADVETATGITIREKNTYIPAVSCLYCMYPATDMENLVCDNHRFTIVTKHIEGSTVAEEGSVVRNAKQKI